MTQEDEATGCGISKWWLTSPNDPFADACSWHDAAYTVGSEAESALSRAETDKQFLKMMMLKADSFWLKARALGYYLIARGVGKKYWEGKE